MPALDLRLSGWRPIRHGLKQHLKRLRHSDRIRIGNLFINHMKLGFRMPPSSILACHTGRILAEDPAGKCAFRNTRKPLTPLDISTRCVYYVDVRSLTFLPMSKRINIVLPEATVQTIDRMTKPGQRSRFINHAVQRSEEHTSE